MSNSDRDYLRLLRRDARRTRGDSQREKREATAVLILLLVLLPLPRYWPLFNRAVPGVNAVFTGLNLYLADVALLLLLLTAVPRLKRRSTGVKNNWLTWPLVGLVGLTAVSCLNALDVTLALYQTIRLLMLLALYLVILHLRPQPGRVQVGLVLVLVSQTAVALLQFIGQDDLGLAWLGEIDLNRYPGGGSILAVNGQYWLRAYGLTPHPNILGGLLVVLILALLAAYLGAKPRHRLFWLLVLLSGLAALLLTFSRAAWLGGMVGGLVLIVGVMVNRTWRQRYDRALALLVVAGGLLLAGLGWSQRGLLHSRLGPAANSFEARSVDERAALHRIGWQLFQLAPLTGIGGGNTAVATLPLVQNLPGVGAQPVHNTPFLVGIELGLPGALLWGWLMAAPLFVAGQRLRQGRLTLWGLSLTAALAALAVIDCFDYYAWSWPQGQLLRWTVWGLWAATI